MSSDRHIIPYMEDFIKSWSGLRLSPKKQGDYYVIGYGHSFDSGIHEDTRWTIKQAEEAFTSDIAKCEDIVDEKVKGITLTDIQFGVLISYCFSAGYDETPYGLKKLIEISEYWDDYSLNIYQLPYKYPVIRNDPNIMHRRLSEQILFRAGSDVQFKSIPPKQIGETGDRVKYIQHLLDEQVGPLMKTLDTCNSRGIEADGILGRQTRASLITITQMELNELGAGLVVDGVLGDKTIQALYKYNISVTKGSTGIMARIVKIILALHGYGIYNKNQIAVFDSNWVSHLVEYQMTYGLVIDGIAGPVFFTWSLRDSGFNNSY